MNVISVCRRTLSSQKMNTKRPCRRARLLDEKTERSLIPRECQLGPFRLQGIVSGLTSSRSLDNRSTPTGAPVSSIVLELEPRDSGAEREERRGTESKRPERGKANPIGERPRATAVVVTLTVLLSTRYHHMVSPVPVASARPSSAALARLLLSRTAEERAERGSSGQGDRREEWKRKKIRHTRRAGRLH